MTEPAFDVDYEPPVALLAAHSLYGGQVSPHFPRILDAHVDGQYCDIRFDGDAFAVERGRQSDISISALEATIGAAVGVAPRVRASPEPDDDDDGPDLPANDNDPSGWVGAVLGVRSRERFELTWFDEIEESQPKEHVIAGFLGLGEMSVLVGKPGTGKSVITTDAACHVGANMTWHGRTVKHGLVVYVAAERKKVTERRMLAFRKRHGVSDVALVVIGGRLDMTRDVRDAAALVQAVKAAEERAGLPCVWIIIDTVTRTFGGGDQNTSKDMGRYVQSTDEIMLGTGAHVTLIHHTPWNEDRGKGAIDLDGAVDASFIVKKSGKTYVLSCDGSNDGEEGTITAFALESVEVGRDADGVPTTAPIVVAKEVGNLAGVSLADVPQDVGPTGVSAAALASLRASVEADGLSPEGGAYPEGVRVVNEETWRRRFYADAGTDVKVDTLKKRFQRALRDLLAEGHAKQVGLWFWPT
ncbi:AAA family ATPase [Chelatococcus asaccharovorans]|uniref:AAA family ATPase n=1 Tax=Chelatococcus asaccharovorans TaxID=28210 RepID=UPI00224C725C|nr:AAA family ATPase [Chelatococcus asaccharovorans]CAH1649709.1 hypothetical protein CHELA40_10262 [Chelatococcus asaccharovorans]CAH1686920.1 hypothetical protein CHELA17_65348 [Chelatococcus asaccharovorans]